MDTTNYDLGFAVGQVPIKDFIQKSYYSEAEEYADLFRELTFKGNIRRDNRTPEQVQKDKEAIDLLLEFKRKGVDNNALAYGFMLYNETSITKIYWTKRVGKLRQDKREFFALDKYLQWLTSIFTMLTGKLEAFPDPLYYFKPGGKSRKGKSVGDYDVMNSFRTHWNMYFLPILAMYLYREDMKEEDQGISIDAALENENGAGQHLEAELAQKGKMIHSPEADSEFFEIENFLKEFTKSPLCDPIPFNAGTVATGVTYRDIMRSIVDGTMNNPTNIRAKYKIGLSIQERIMNKIKDVLEKYGVGIQELADYIAEYRTVALDILDGKEASFANYD